MTMEVMGQHLDVPMTGAFDGAAGRQSAEIDMGSMFRGLGDDVPTQLAGLGGTMELVRDGDVLFMCWDLLETLAGSRCGSIDLSAQLSRADGKATARYLPLSSIMGARSREWVASAVLEGQATDARLRLKGDLRDFPFIDPAKGLFQVTAKVNGAVLDYAAGWPRIEAIEGNLTFERDRIEVLGQSGTILGVKISNVRVTLPSMLAPDQHLIVDGNAEGPTALFLDYIRESPVRRMTSGFTEAMSAQGRGKLKLHLDLALRDMARSKVAGDFQFASNTVVLDARLPPVERASGRVGFTESTLTIGDVRGNLLGGDVRLSGGSRGDAGVVIAAEGRATVEGLRALVDHPWRRRLSGAARYAVSVTVKEGRSLLALDSSLEGLASSLPAPLAKAAAVVLPLRVEVFPGEGRDRISVALGPVTGLSITRVRCTCITGAPPALPPAAAGCAARRNSAVMMRPVAGPSATEMRSRPSPGNTSTRSGSTSAAAFASGAGKLLARPSSDESRANSERPSFTVTDTA